MAYRFRSDESIPKNIKRIARRQIESAIGHLHRWVAGNRDEAVHEARKRLKKVRALTRLVQLELGGEYKTISRRISEVAGTLSELRDAAALITTLDKLQDERRRELPEGSLGAIRKALHTRKTRIDREMDSRRLFGKMAGALDRVRQTIDRWPLEADGFPAIEAGLENIFARGRRTMILTRRHKRPDDFHEWRKRVKDHWYHVRLLQDLWTDYMKGYETSLEKLENWLGEDHNLVLLRREVSSAPAVYGQERDINRLFRAIDSAQGELRTCAFSFGRRVYSPKPRRLVRQIGDLWEMWLADSGKCAEQEQDAA